MIRDSTHGPDDLCHVCVEETLCYSHVLQHLPHRLLEEAEQQQWDAGIKEENFSLHSTHVDLIADGYEAHDAQVQASLQGKAIYDIIYMH